MSFTRPSVRRVLEAVLRSDSDLNAFCGDYFPDVYRRYTDGMDRVKKVNLLLDYVATAKIIEALRDGYPSAMQEYGAMLQVAAEPAPAAAPPEVAAPPAPSPVAVVPGPVAAPVQVPPGVAGQSPAPAPSAPVAAFSGADPALDELREAYQGGNLVVFAGAGISMAAGLPSWHRLVQLLSDRARARGASPAALSEIHELIEKHQLIEALSAVKDCLGGPEFGAVIERHLNDRDRPVPEVAHAIAALAPRLRAVLTTNLDHLLERALRWPALARATGDIAQRQGVILKLHGTLLDRSTWVFTRDEYDRAMYADPRLQSAFAALFHACPLLFVGYGLADADFDQVLGRVRAFAGDQPPRHFTLVAADTVTPHRRGRLERSGIQLIAYDNSDGKHSNAVRLLRALATTGG